MAFVRLEVREGTFQQSTGAPTTYNLAKFVEAVAQTSATQEGKRILAFSCRVKLAGDGTGTVSFGTTTGGVAALMSTAEVGGAGPPAARKIAATGSELAGNGVKRVPGAAEEFITATYTKGTNTVNPIIVWRAVLIREDQMDRLFVL